MSDFYHKPSAVAQTGAAGFSKPMKTFVDYAVDNKLDLLYAQLRIGNRIIDDYLTHPLRTRMNVFEVSEGAVGLGAGIAIKEGLLTPEDRVCEYFPEYVTPHTSLHLKEVTLYHLLTMTVGVKGEIFICDDAARYETKDWLEAFFNAEFTDAPGKRFVHCCLNTYVIACMIEKKAGVPLSEYLRDRLFEPIGIGNPDWLPCPKGHTMGFNGLYLTDQEIANIGQLILCNGSLNYHDILSEAFVKQMCTPHADAGNGMQYGMHVWILPDLENTILLKGRFGQGVAVARDKNAVLSFLSLEGYRYEELQRKAAEVLRLV